MGLPMQIGLHRRAELIARVQRLFTRAALSDRDNRASADCRNPASTHWLAQATMGLLIKVPMWRL